MQEIYEKEAFLQQTVTEYHKAIGEFKESGMKTVMLDATRSMEELAAIIWKEIEMLQEKD